MVGSGILVGTAEAEGVKVAAAVSVGVTVGVSVGLGVGVMVGVGEGGAEVGTGSVGITVGIGMDGENVNQANAIIEKQSRITSTARILNCGQVRPMRGLFCLLGDGCIQEPFTGQIKRKKCCQNWIYL